MESAFSATAGRLVAARISFTSAGQSLCPARRTWYLLFAQGPPVSPSQKRHGGQRCCSQAQIAASSTVAGTVPHPRPANAVRTRGECRHWRPLVVGQNRSTRGGPWGWPGTRSAHKMRASLRVMGSLETQDGGHLTDLLTPRRLPGEEAAQREDKAKHSGRACKRCQGRAALGSPTFRTACTAPEMCACRLAFFFKDRWWCTVRRVTVGGCGTPNECLLPSLLLSTSLLPLA